MTGMKTAPASVADLLRGFSIEVNPNEAKVIDAIPDRLDRDTEIFLTWIPGTDPMEMLGPASKLRRAGFFPVPHVGARHVESAGQLEELAARLAGEANVDRILIIGGDRNKPAGPYDSSLAIMQSGVFQKNGILRTAVAGFPEGNPNIPDAVLFESLLAKANFARAAGLQLSIVTQFCFAAHPIVEWLQRIRGLAIDVPVRVGLAGPAGLLTLTRYAIRCGVGNSLRVLTEKPSFAKLLIEKGPEPIIREIASALATTDGASPTLNVAGLHFFVFGGFNKTVDWIRAEKGDSLSH